MHNSYSAFVDLVIEDTREFGTLDQVAAYVEGNPDATAGDVATYSARLAGLI